MTKYYHENEDDRQLIKKSFDNISLLIFGTSTNGQMRINNFKKLFDNQVSEVNVFPQGTKTKHLSDYIPGVCRLDEQDKIIIEMLGYKGANSSQHSFIKHEGTHEFCHAFVALLPKIFDRNHDGNGIIKDGIKVRSHMGMIEETNPQTGEKVGQHYYGKMFNETSMDIFTSMAINCFDSNNSRPVDNILQNNYHGWGNTTTGYSIFTSLTRLAIAAFSNNGNVNYQNIVNAGGSMFSIETTMKNGEKRKANDFLYGMVFDQLHIEEEFDKIMGYNYYRHFCEYLDRLFMMTLSNQQLPSDEVKRVMNILPDFLNKKMTYYQKNGLIDVNDSNKIISNFNKIWNSMQFEYNAYFSQTDIDQIAQRAGRK